MAYQLKGERFSFITDRGVFSKNEVDFGSKLLIESIDLPKVQGAILDVGCGYGPIGLALGKTNPERKVVMIDVNERACELAEKNAQKNGVENAEVRFMETGMLELNEQELFAMVVTNLQYARGNRLFMVSMKVRTNICYQREYCLLLFKRSKVLRLRDRSWKSFLG